MSFDSLRIAYEIAGRAQVEAVEMTEQRNEAVAKANRLESLLHQHYLWVVETLKEFGLPCENILPDAPAYAVSSASNLQDLIHYTRRLRRQRRTYRRELRKMYRHARALRGLEPPIKPFELSGREGEQVQVLQHRTGVATKRPHADL